MKSDGRAGDRSELRLGRRAGTGNRFAAAVDSLLTPDRLLVYPVTVLAVFGAAVGVAVGLGGARPLPDFAARWTAGYLLLTGRSQDLYDPTAQWAVQQQHMVGTDLSLFVSPPFTAAIFAPFASLPYAVACFTWAAVSLACLLVSAELIRRMVAPGAALSRRRALLPVFASYPVLELLGGGQDTSVVLLAIVSGMWLLRSHHEGAAGLVLSFGLIKPHLMLLVPVVLLARGHLRALGSFGAAALALGAASVAVAGWGGSLDWLRLITGSAYGEVVQRGQAWKSASGPGFINAFLPPGAPRAWDFVSLLAGLAVLIFAAIVIARHGRRAHPLLVWGFALASTCLGTPHLLVYDLVLLFPVILALAERAWDTPVRAALTTYSLLLFLVAPVHALAGANWPTAVLGAPWHVLGLVWLWNRLRLTVGNASLAGDGLLPPRWGTSTA